MGRLGAQLHPASSLPLPFTTLGALVWQRLVSASGEDFVTSLCLAGSLGLGETVEGEDSGLRESVNLQQSRWEPRAPTS